MDETTDKHIAALQADVAALTLITSTLMQLHPDLDRFHLTLTRNLQQQLGNGALSLALKPGQQQRVRDFIETLGAIRQPPRSAR